MLKDAFLGVKVFSRTNRVSTGRDESVPRRRQIRRLVVVRRCERHD